MLHRCYFLLGLFSQFPDIFIFSGPLSNYQQGCFWTSLNKVIFMSRIPRDHKLTAFLSPLLGALHLSLSDSPGNALISTPFLPLKENLCVSKWLWVSVPMNEWRGWNFRHLSGQSETFSYKHLEMEGLHHPRQHRQFCHWAELPCTKTGLSVSKCSCSFPGRRVSSAPRWVFVS